MYVVIRSKRFEKSFRRLKKTGAITTSVREDIGEALVCFTRGEALPARFRDHHLRGEYAAYRECHLKGDLLVMYRKDEGQRAVVLMDIGTHAQLFG